MDGPWDVAAALAAEGSKRKERLQQFSRDKRRRAAGGRVIAARVHRRTRVSCVFGAGYSCRSRDRVVLLILLVVASGRSYWLGFKPFIIGVGADRTGAGGLAVLIIIGLCGALLRFLLGLAIRLLRRARNLRNRQLRPLWVRILGGTLI